jgi:putative ABC transport system permease protein
MSTFEQLRFALQSLLSNRVRSALILLSMAVGIAGVVLLTWLGECGRHYIVDQFAQLGTNLVIVLPGRNETTGSGPPPLFGETSRDLTLDDALALQRSSAVSKVAPLILGAVSAAHGDRERETMVLGSTAEMQEVRHLDMAAGSFLPPGDPRSASAVCVIGQTVRDQLFPSAPAIGEWLRLGNRRYRVIGIMSNKGRSLGTDLDEMVVLPVAAAQALFDTRGLFRILVEARNRESVDRAVKDAEQIIATRHEGEADVTVITQESVLSTVDRVLRAITLAVAGIAAISLWVAGILIMNVMVVAVSQRRAEIGLLKALGAPSLTIRRLFLWEALLLSLSGALCGLVLAEILSRILPHFQPVLLPGTPVWAAVLAGVTALLIGTAFGILPARKAARLDPVLALARR